MTGLHEPGSASPGGTPGRVGPFDAVREIARAPGLTFAEAFDPDGVRRLLQVVRLRAAQGDADRDERVRLERGLALRTADLVTRGVVEVHAHGGVDVERGERLIFWALPWAEVFDGAERGGPGDAGGWVRAGLGLAQALRARHQRGVVDALLSERVLDRRAERALAVPAPVETGWLAPGFDGARLAPEERHVAEATSLGDVWRLGRLLLEGARGVSLPDPVLSAFRALSAEDQASRVDGSEAAVELLAALASRLEAGSQGPAVVATEGRGFAAEEPTLLVGRSPPRIAARAVPESEAVQGPTAVSRPRAPGPDRDEALAAVRARAEAVFAAGGAEPSADEVTHRAEPLSLAPEVVVSPSVLEPARALATSTEDHAAAVAALEGDAGAAVGAVAPPPGPTEISVPDHPSGPPAESHDAQRRAGANGHEVALEALAATWTQPVIPSGESPWSEVVIPRGMQRRAHGAFPGLDREVAVPPGLPPGPRTDPAKDVEAPALAEPLEPRRPGGSAEELDPEEVAAIAGFDARKLVAGVLAVLVIFGVFALVGRSSRREVAPDVEVVPAANDVLLESDPPGATVVAEADGAVLGKTPLRFLLPPRAAAEVFLTAPGHEPYRLELPERGVLRARLSPLDGAPCEVDLANPGGVALEVVGGARVERGGPLRVDGGVVVRAVEGEPVAGARLVLCPALGGPSRVALRLEPRPGPRVVRVTEPAGAAAYLGGEPLGRVPAAGRVRGAFALVRVDDASGMGEERWVPVTADLEVRMVMPRPRKLPVLVLPEVDAPPGPASPPSRREDRAPVEPEDPRRAAARAQHDAGWAHLEAGRVMEAREPLRECLRLAPDLPECHRALGVLYRKLRNPTKAALHLQRYLELAPDAPDAERVRRDLVP